MSDKKKGTTPKNWSGLWINREDALVKLDDNLDEYRNYQNDYERGLFDAYYNCSDFISGMEGHDSIPSETSKPKLIWMGYYDDWLHMQYAKQIKYSEMRILPIPIDGNKVNSKEIVCQNCEYYDTEEEYCKALSCNPLNCDEPLPCEIEE